MAKQDLTGFYQFAQLRWASGYFRSSTAVYRASLLFALLLLCCLPAAQAQQLLHSEVEKVNANFLSYQIVGKAVTGTMIYKNMRDREQVDLYNEEMGLIRRKRLGPLNTNITSVKLFLQDEYLYHFYTYKEKRVEFLAMQRYSAKLEDVGKVVVLDSITKRLPNMSDYKIRRPERGSTFMIFREETKGGDSYKIHATLYDAVAKPIWDETIQVDKGMRGVALNKVLLSNAGDAIFVTRPTAGRLKQNEFGEVRIFHRMNGTAAFREAIYTEDKLRAPELYFGWDELNRRLTISGFYTQDNNRLMSKGLLFTALDLATDKIEVQTRTDFDEKIIQRIKGKAIRKKEQLPIYDVKEVVHRSDGGVVIAAEYINESSEAYEYTDYDPYFGGYRTSTRYINYHEYQDIVVFILESDGTLVWEDVIRKKQVSREDYGRNSSFCMVNTRNQLLFIFNEDISYDTNVMQYALNTRGELIRRSLFNANQNDLMLVPKKAKQISSNELIIPSVYKNNISFVKLVF